MNNVQTDNFKHRKRCTKCMEWKLSIPEHFNSINGRLYHQCKICSEEMDVSDKK